MIKKVKTASQPKRDIFKVDLKGLKKPYMAYCKRIGIKAGPSIREAIARQLNKEQTPHEANREIIAKPDRTRTGIKINLTESEHTALDELAEKQGLTVNQYIIQLSRNHLLKTPQFSLTEIEALRESNIQLMGLGRNLNQIARALNAEDPDEHRPTVKEIKNLSDKIYQHTHEVSNLIRANIERWKIE
jgi:hypothetical protein